jgi:hypothetical protein
MEELEGIDPKDIADLEAIARKIEIDNMTSYRITIVLNHETAIDFIESYEDSSNGDPVAFKHLLEYIGAIAFSVFTAVTEDDEEDPFF